MDSVYVDHVSVEDSFKDTAFRMIIDSITYMEGIDTRLLFGENPIREKKMFKVSVLKLFRFIKPQMIEYVKSLEKSEDENEKNDREIILHVLEKADKYDMLGSKHMTVIDAKELFDWLSYFSEIYGLTKVKPPKRQV